MRIDKDNIKIILILLVVCLGIGYSYLNTELNINGTANINSANWSVYWNNVQVESSSVSAPTPTIDSDKTTVSYTVTLDQPGDYYEFTVDAVNAGTIDAMIETIDSKLNGVTMEEVPAYLDYEISYADDTPLEENQELLHDSTETYKVHIGYSENIEADELPTTNQSLSLEFTVTYRQATEEAQEVDHPITKYTANIYDDNVTGNNMIWIGQAIPNGITQYNSASEALTALRSATSDNNIQFYFKHTIQGGIVTESYVEFVVTPEMASANSGMTAGTYALRGLNTYDENASSTNYCKPEYYNSSTEECLSPYYETNKETLLRAFSSSYCTDYSYGLTCDVTGLETFTDNSGNVSVRSDGGQCYIDSDGSSRCRT